jgi:hypothetical protein
MDREMQLRLYEPYYSATNNVRLSEFPVDEQFVNPGIGVQMFDFMVALHGKEDYELKKKTQMLPASLSEKNSLVENKEAHVLNSDLKQEGFGNKDFIEKSQDTTFQEKGLEQSILSAMKHAKIKTDQVTYVPEKKRKQMGQKGEGPCAKFALKDKFKLV